MLSDLEPTSDRDARKAELFYAGAAAEWKTEGFGVRAEIRGKDGRFRPYYGGDVWLEEGWALVETPLGGVRVGKLPRGFGLEDETFSGTLFSLNGVTRNPDWGASLTGEKRFGFNALGWGLWYFGQNDHVAWEEDVKGVEGDPLATLRDGLEGRVTYHYNQGLWSLRPGVSFATARIVRTGGLPEFRRTDESVDVTATFGPLAVGIQALWRQGEPGPPAGVAERPGYEDGLAGLVFFRAEFPSVIYRYSYSEWRYRETGGNERLHQPSVVWKPRKWVELTIEFDARRVRNSSGARAYNAFRFGLALLF